MYTFNLLHIHICRQNTEISKPREKRVGGGRRMWSYVACLIHNFLSRPGGSQVHKDIPVSASAGIKGKHHPYLSKKLELQAGTEGIGEGITLTSHVQGHWFQFPAQPTPHAHTQLYKEANSIYLPLKASQLHDKPSACLWTSSS